MRLNYRSIICLIILWLIIGTSLSAQNSKLAKLQSLYKDEKYEEAYLQSLAINDPAIEVILMEALAFNLLSETHPEKNKVDDKALYPLEKVQKIQALQDERTIKYKNFFLTELKKLQEIIFAKAKSLYNKGSKDKSRLYFDKLHATFNNSRPILKNHFSFDDSYFRQTLKKEIEVPQEFKRNFFSRYDLFQKYYLSNEKFKEWNNPIYRLANTAKNENYLTKDEKMVFYFLNLVRMNPELFLETFINAKLHIKYHGDLQLEIPVFDSLKINKYKGKLSFQEFFELPVHRMYNNELPGSVVEKFVKKTVVQETKRGKKFRYDIKFQRFYEYLEKEKPELLQLRNLNSYHKAENGNEYLLYKVYEKKQSIYRKSYKKETKNNHYYQSLFEKLRTMSPKSIIYPSKELFKTAECWAVEAGRKGLKGHDRVNCKPDYHAESCDYGNKNGFDVVLNLLVDKFVTNLGHRKMLLGNYSKMGVAIRPHKSGFEYNAVLNFFK